MWIFFKALLKHYAKQLSHNGKATIKENCNYFCWRKTIEYFQRQQSKETTQHSLKPGCEPKCWTSELHMQQAIQNIDMKETNHGKPEHKVYKVNLMNYKWCLH